MDIKIAYTTPNSEDEEIEYIPLDGDELKATITAIEREISVEAFDRCGEPHRREKWEKGWRETLAQAKELGISDSTLQPGYCHHNVFRLFNQLIRTEDYQFESKINKIIRRISFKKYLKDFEQIVEFGSGTGTSMRLLAEIFPEKELIATDWTSSSLELINLIAKSNNTHINCQQFDMLIPSNNLPIKRNKAAFLTCHSLEQLGTEYQPFLNFILEKQPGICLHIEPILELYNPSNRLDELAIQYHEKRNYLKGFLSTLKTLEKDGRAEIVKVKRIGFGSRYHEGNTLIVWRPIY